MEVVSGAELATMCGHFPLDKFDVCACVDERQVVFGREEREALTSAETAQRSHQTRRLLRMAGPGRVV